MNPEYMDLDRQGNVLETGVLVLGGGLAGLWASIKARALIDDVLIVDKGPLNWGGLGSMCGGDMDVWDPNDDVMSWVDDLVYYFDGLIEQDVIELLMRKSYERFLDYEEMGHRFARDDRGNLRRVKQRGLDHVSALLSRPFGTGGHNLVSVLVNRTNQLGVRRLGRIQITNIIKDGEGVAGVVGFHTRSGEFYIIKAKVIIVATGNANWKSSYGTNTCAGEGFAIALDAGVRMRNFEYLKVWNVPKDFAWEGQTMLLPLGARFVNALGEDFMNKYSPKLGAKMDPHYNTRAMAEEYLAGRGPIYFDASAMRDEDVELLTPTGGWMGVNYTRLRQMGMDFFKDKLEWIPQINYAIGGIDADIEGQSNVKGIFAAGRARNLEPGVYLGGWAVSGTATTGAIAGENGAKMALSFAYQPRIDPALTAKIKHEVLAPLGKAGIHPKEVLNELREVVAPYDVSILKSEKGLSRALNRLKEIQEELLPLMAAESPHYLMKANEVRAMAQVTEMYLTSSLLRKETRGGHYRVDYPGRDDHYFGWFLISKERGKLSWSFRRVPVENYKVKPNRYYMDLFQSPGNPIIGGQDAT
ncbi:MAG TPA: FAD-binding protein [Syntrophorhabdales bacterium]|nr:FAD-binding protein [Syntrophorhabdales bacterium]